MTNLIRPIVLVHGLWNTPDLFEHLIDHLNQPSNLLMAPFLPHYLGRVGIRDLAFELDKQIKERFGNDVPIDLIGFSMGGLIARVWIQEMKGFTRTIRFFSIGCPHKGTLTAQLVPGFLFAGIADMKLQSDLIKSLEISSDNLQEIRCKSFFSLWDLMVFPGYRAVLPFGTSIAVPVFTHKGLIKNSKSIEMISSYVLSAS